MIAILLDSNIYDRLAEDLATCERLKTLIRSANVRIIVSRTVAEELTRSPLHVNLIIYTELLVPGPDIDALDALLEVYDTLRSPLP